MNKTLISIVSLMSAPLALVGAETAVFGKIEVPNGERLISSIEIRSKVTFAKDKECSAPVFLFEPLPVYPSSMTRAGVVGNAVVSFYITDEGVVQEVKVESTSEPDFGQACVGAVVNWRFWPAEKDSKHVGVHATARFTFSMYDDEG